MTTSSSITLMAMFGLRVGPAADRSVAPATRLGPSGEWNDTGVNSDEGGFKVQIGLGAWRKYVESRPSASQPTQILPALPDALPLAASDSSTAADRESSSPLDVSFVESTNTLYLPTPRAGATRVERQPYRLGTIIDTYA